MASCSPSTIPPTDPAAPLACCRECPRACGVDRLAGQRGVCGASAQMEVGRAALHFWEEPPISGDGGSGTIFFGHCPLGCSYCQNARLAVGEAGLPCTVGEVAAAMLSLQEQGALNINLVTATHYGPLVRAAVTRARGAGLDLPIVWNTSGYETVAAIRDNAETVDVYLTDFKYASAETAAAYSHAPDYPTVALAAIDSMVDLTGPPIFDEYRGQQRLVRGVVIRHLMLPGHERESFDAVQLLFERYGNRVLYSLMNQYTPLLAHRAAEGDEGAQRVLQRYPELRRTVPAEAYEALLDFADSLGMEEYFWQDGPAASESFIPDFE
ncbi:MAG: radical SAM protein [Eggerthellaceae bacterium]|nr:radical SAM protein [Eggerthellaceae bacterium]